jgi:ribosomal protein S18 acetylase RimI-like enzyme
MTIKRINPGEDHLVTDLFDQYRVFYQQPSDKALAGSFIQERLANNESVIFAALDQQPDSEETAIGFTQLYPKYSSVQAVKNWILNDLYVAAGHRKKGVGKGLIKAAMQFAKEAGAQAIQLETAKNNHTAQRLYEAIGFKKHLPDSSYLTYHIEL